jgi:tripartite-type tricarboxylate transporter receptor subunit TctC
MRPKPFAIVTGASLIRVRDEQSNQTPAPKKQKLKGVISPVLLVAAAPLLLCHVAAAQTWPTKPVRLVTAFATGGSSDSIARIIAEPLPSALGQQVVVDNRSGGNGVAGTAIAANAPPDGYIFLVVFDSHATNASLNKKLPYDTQTDFAPVMLLASSPYALLVSPSSSFRSLAEIISAAKAKPGELTPRAPAASAAADTLLSHSSSNAPDSGSRKSPIAVRRKSART